MLKEIAGGVCAPKGFKANGIHCGIRKNKIKKDLALIVSDVRCHVACVYTTNLVKGAPILVTQKNVSDGYAQAVIVNSGNANTCNADGVEIAEKMCSLVEMHAGIPAGRCCDCLDGRHRTAALRGTYCGGNARTRQRSGR